MSSKAPRHANGARRSRRRALLIGAGVVVVAGALAAATLTWTGGTSGHPARRKAATQPAHAANPAHAATPARQAPAPPAVESGLLPWKLPNPLSRLVVLPGAGQDLVLAGGLTAAQTTTAGVAVLDTSTGSVSPAGTMASGVHDAAGAAVAGRDFVFGGGSPATTGAVQTLPAAGTQAQPAAGGARGAAAGTLPQPRSDLSAASIGDTTYLVGGYDGTNPTAEVLATTDGKRFDPVAKLPVPVRYPAVAASGGQLFVFGGQAIGGGSQPVDVIQRVDPPAHRASVVGKLPVPLEAAAAVNLGGVIYVAGGDAPTGSAPAATPGAGTTQLNGWATGAGSPTPGLTTVSQVWAFDPAGDRLLDAGRLQVPVSHAGAAVSGGRAWLVGGESGGRVMGTVQMLEPSRSFGVAGAPGAGSPYFGTSLLVADRGNNRLMMLDPSMQVTWTYPGPGSPPDPLGFYFPDDAFFVRHGTAIISNQEENETIIQIAYPSGKVIWSYGHPKQTGTATGYLHEPDDAYLLRNGQISVADAQNCRVLVLNPGGTVASQIGTNGVCRHQPASFVGSPNGDTPLWDGNLLVSEINGSWVSEYTPAGHLVWSAHLPIAYPSDPQQLGASATANPDRYLIADYSTPGAVLQFTREGQVLSTYRVAAGPGMLDHPSLAEELPSGVYMVNDDHNDRMVAIDPATGALVWQYGTTGHAGATPGMLNNPDGFDLLGPGGTTPTHPQTG